MTIDKTTFDEDLTVKKILPDKLGVLCVKAYEIQNADLPTLIRMVKVMELGKVVRTHFEASQTQMLLRSDVAYYLQENEDTEENTNES